MDDEQDVENRIQISPAFGTIEPYRESTEAFENYLSRVDIYFVANHIAEARKAPIFLSSCGAKLFSTAVNILDPIKIEKATYKQICEALRSHYKPRTLVIYERYVFNGRYQKPGESIADFVAALKECIKSCEYLILLNK